MTAPVLTVRQLNLYVRSLLEGDAKLALVYVAGELSNFKNHYGSGHLYFSLKDADALVRAVMFRGNASRLRFAPQEGMRVICRGRISLYEKDGQYQFYVEEMQPDGAGSLAVAFEQCKQRLAAEGLFDEAHKRPIPPYPERVAVVTSETGAALQDILQIFGRRWPLAEILLAPVLVQGSEAAAALTGAIRRLSTRRDVDLILIGRGGGSVEDLWAFNDEALARAIYACPIPVISAVGHETDFTICDFVADLRAPTLSAAAELATPDAAALSAALIDFRGRLQTALRRQIDAGQLRLDAVLRRTPFSHPNRLAEPLTQRLDALSARLESAAAALLKEKQNAFSLCAARLEASSPLRILSRGYAVARRTDDRQVVRLASQLAPGDDLQIQFSDGAADCRVTAVKGADD